MTERKPWKVVVDGLSLPIIVGDGGLYVAFMKGQHAEANAEFIVRACNAHDALVELLQAILVVTESPLSELPPGTSISDWLSLSHRMIRSHARLALATADPNEKPPDSREA